MSTTITNTAAERAVLIALLHDPGLYETVTARIPTSEVFHQPLNREIYEAMCRAVDTSGVTTTPYDPYSLAADVETRTNEPAPGGGAPLDYLIDLTTAMPVADVTTAITHLTDAHIRTHTSELLTHTTRALATAGSDTRETLHTTIEALQQASSDLTREQTPVQALAEIADTVIETILTGSQQTYLPTGYTELDDILDGGLIPGALYIIGARPSVGKSAMALDIARHLTIREHANTMFVNLEMRPSDLFTRLLAAEKSIPASQLTRAMKSTDGAPADLARRVTAAHATLNDAVSLSTDPLSPPVDGKGNLWVWSPYSESRRGSGRRTVADVAEILDQMRTAGQVDCLIVDYLQLLEPAVKTESRQNDVAATVRYLKELALRHDIPVIVLAQVNRGSTERADKRPMLSDLRESGEIEQAADAVFLLHNEAKARGEDPNESLLDVIVAKNRHGRDATFHLVPELDYCRFANVDAAAFAITNMDF